MNKLDGIKAGDRVRVTFEGEVTSLEMDHFFPIRFLPDGAKIPSSPNLDTIEADSFQIIRIEPALVVGQMVTWGRGVDDWEVVAIKGEIAVIYNRLRAEVKPLSELRRA